MKLLIDLGNTRLKSALWDGTRLDSRPPLIHGGGNAHSPAALWKNIPNIDAVWIASVAQPTLDAALADAVRTHFGMDPNFVHSRAQACGVRNAYAQPERLGVDRFLGLIAAYAHARAPAVIAGCGTALTLDALDADGIHLGGLIAPSPGLMQAALRGNTARLGEADAARIVELADNTADAVESGSWLAATALVERFNTRAAQRLGTAPALILTGGGAVRLTGLLGLPHRVDTDLVLRGLARFAESST
jgi:type III pantothenate kinase